MKELSKSEKKLLVSIISYSELFTNKVESCKDYYGYNQEVAKKKALKLKGKLSE